MIGSTIQKVEWDEWDSTLAYQNPVPLPPIPTATESTGLVKVKLISVAYGRSGDKGDVSNVGKYSYPARSQIAY